MKPADSLHTKIVKMYLYNDKESNWDKGEEIGLNENAIRENFAYALYEVEFDVEVNMITGETTILAVNGRQLQALLSQNGGDI